MRLCQQRHYLPEKDISIHAPLAGCDGGATWLFPCHCDFNPRTPCGVRRALWREELQQGCFSIHAPLAGCDAAIGKRHSITPLFQSTHPLRGATPHLLVDKIIKQISIHAPLAGCDSKNTQKIFCIFAITDNKSRKDNVQRRLSERFPYKTWSIYLQK